MSDYINRQAAIEALEKRGVSTTNISRVPIADVRENAKGKWIQDKHEMAGYGYFDCSVCGADFYEIDGFNFCPNCGADMRGDI